MKVLDQLVMACRTMNFACTTESCYRQLIKDYLHVQSLRSEHVTVQAALRKVRRPLAGPGRS